MTDKRNEEQKGYYQMKITISLDTIDELLFAIKKVNEIGFRTDEVFWFELDE